MILTSITACSEKRKNGGGFANNYIVGMQFTFGSLNSENQITDSVELLSHGAIRGSGCQVVNFSPDEYIASGQIAVDFFEPTINKLVFVK